MGTVQAFSTVQTYTRALVAPANALRDDDIITAKKLADFNTFVTSLC